MKVYLEKWQVKNLRDYFGENDKTQTEHWAFKVFDDALKNKQCIIDVVVKQSELLVCTYCGIQTNQESCPHPKKCASKEKIKAN